MKLKSILALCLLIGLAVGSACAQKISVSTDPISGTWTGNWGPNERQRSQVTLDLHFDGKALTGTVNPGADPLPLKKATFDPKTAAVHMEIDVKTQDGTTDHYVVDGKIDKNTMTGDWSRNNGKGDFTITRSQN